MTRIRRMLNLPKNNHYTFSPRILAKNSDLFYCLKISRKLMVLVKYSKVRLLLFIDSSLHAYMKVWGITWFCFWLNIHYQVKCEQVHYRGASVMNE